LLIHRYLNGETKTKAERMKVAEIVEQWRERLCDISWFMRCLNETLARQANAEDRCTGRFWEGRFKSQALLDEAAILTCMAYVDLNPVRAGIAETPEDSDYTSIQERIRHYAEMLPCQKSEPEPAVTDSNESTDMADDETIAMDHPIDFATPAGLSPLIGNERHDQPACGIAFSLMDYLQLVDATGRAIRDDKTGAIPVHLQPILQRLGLDEQAWTDNVRHFGRRFRRVVGSVERIRQMGRTLGQCWLKGMEASRGLYRPVVEI
jgi:hypothetical protein